MSSNTYGSTAKWLHWLIGALVIVMLIGGQTLEALPFDEREQLIMVHSGLGTLVLLAMILRAGWRRTHPPPGPVGTMSDRQIMLAKWVHRGLYTLLVLQPLLGIAQAMFICDYQVRAFGLIN
ncbi:MAG: cytochrome b/b6 domain-containing protein, partial [Proteobacteria bacterium]|nr:cytochrome b/b6 domain-containing protein [Pseudomonadota bacterium]